MKVLMSVDRANKSQSMNAANRALFEKFLSNQGCEWEKVIKCYQEEGQDKPQREQSYLIETRTGKDLRDLWVLAELFEQDSWLEIHPLLNECSLQYFDELMKSEQIGQWIEVSETEAKENGYYTETKDGYFIAW